MQPVWAGDRPHPKVNNELPQGLMAIADITTFCFLCEMQFLELVFLDAKRALIVPAKTCGPSLGKKGWENKIHMIDVSHVAYCTVGTDPPGAPILTSRIWGWVTHPAYALLGTLRTYTEHNGNFMMSQLAFASLCATRCLQILDRALFLWGEVAEWKNIACPQGATCVEHQVFC